MTDNPAYREKRIPKMHLACAQHPEAGSCWIRQKDGHTYAWCYECKGPFAVEREQVYGPDHSEVRRHLVAALDEMGAPDEDERDEP